jgi:hypothetical protein
LLQQDPVDIHCPALKVEDGVEPAPISISPLWARTRVDDRDAIDTLDHGNVGMAYG